MNLVNYNFYKSKAFLTLFNFFFTGLEVALLLKKVILYINLRSTSNTDLMKMVPVEILPNFGNYFRTLKLGF